jgi:hypothetical protein
MKKTIFVAVFALLAAACSNDCNDDEVEKPVEGSDVTAPVTVHVNDFSIVMESLAPEGGTTRAADDPASYQGVGAIDLVLFDADGKNVYSKTQFKKQTSTYTTFGEFTANLPVGHYTMVAIGRGCYDGDGFILTSPTEAAYTSERPRETLCKVQSITVTNTSPLDFDVTLDRITAMLTIQSTDGRPAGISKIRTTYSKGGKSFNPTTGLATSNTGFWQTNSPAAAVGSTIKVNSCPLLASADDEEERIDITIEVLDTNDKVLFTKVVKNVPFKRNNITIVSGKLFTTGPSSFGIKLNTEWGPGYEVTF